ncbi:MAG: NADH-quinone oxidoreductase subunit NuoB [Candidatus Omnitrophota bacterium]
MSVKLKALTKSIWVFHAACSPCNNCDIEVLDLLTPRFDVERLGMVLVGSVRHADALLVTGVPNYKTKERLKKLYEQAPKPCVVIAIGNCSCGRVMFRDSYNSPCTVDEVIPVDVYIPGCPPKPEAMIAGVAKLINKLTGKVRT